MLWNVGVIFSNSCYNNTTCSHFQSFFVWRNDLVAGRLVAIKSLTLRKVKTFGQDTPCETVDGSEIQLTTWYGQHPIVDSVLCIQTVGFLAGFTSTINRTCWKHAVNGIQAPETCHDAVDGNFSSHFSFLATFNRPTSDISPLEPEYGLKVAACSLWRLRRCWTLLWQLDDFKQNSFSPWIYAWYGHVWSTSSHFGHHGTMGARKTHGLLIRWSP